jgi:two-component system sensor histidine kinase KdpD
VPTEIQELLSSLEVIPQRVVNGIPLIDVDRVLERRPYLCVVDGLAYDHPPGSRHAKRWLDVQEILKSGISVVASVNLQFIAEQQAAVERITGKRASQTIPQAFVMTADEIEVVDAPPEMCVAHDPGAAGPRQLAALRELTLLLAADVVDHQLERYLQVHGIEHLWGTQERILVCITPRANATKMIESGKRNADRFHGELFVIYIEQPNLSSEDREAVDSSLEMARQLGAKVEILHGYEPIGTIMDFAHAHGITQVFVGHRLAEHWWEKFVPNPLDRLIAAAEGIDVRVFPH